MHQHCLTGIPKLETFVESADGMSTGNKRQLILFDVTGLPIENVPRELATWLREVLDNGWTIHAGPYGEHNYLLALAWATRIWQWCHFSMQLHNQTFCHQHMTRSSVCWDTLFPKWKQDVPQEQCHINRISMTVYVSFNVYQSSYNTFYCVFHVRFSV